MLRIGDPAISRALRTHRDTFSPSSVTGMAVLQSRPGAFQQQQQAFQSVHNIHLGERDGQIEHIACSGEFLLTVGTEFRNETKVAKLQLFKIELGGKPKNEGQERNMTDPLSTVDIALNENIPNQNVFVVTWTTGGCVWSITETHASCYPFDIHRANIIVRHDQTRRVKFSGWEPAQQGQKNNFDAAPVATKDGSALFFCRRVVEPRRNVVALFRLNLGAGHDGSVVDFEYPALDDTPPGLTKIFETRGGTYAVNYRRAGTNFDYLTDMCVMAVHPSGKRIAWGCRDRILMMEARDSKAPFTEATPIDVDAENAIFLGAAWSHDGKKLVVVDFHGYTTIADGDPNPKRFNFKGGSINVSHYYLARVAVSNDAKHVVILHPIGPKDTIVLDDIDVETNTRTKRIETVYTWSNMTFGCAGGPHDHRLFVSRPWGADNNMQIFDTLPKETPSILGSMAGGLVDVLTLALGFKLNTSRSTPKRGTASRQDEEPNTAKRSRFRQQGRRARSGTRHKRSV